MEPATSIGEQKRQLGLDGGDTNSVAAKIYRSLKDARLAESAPIIVAGGWWGHDRMKPSHAVKWAKDCGYDVPEPLRELMIESRAPESPAERRKRLTQEVEAERRKGRKDFNQVVATRNGMSVSNLKRLTRKRSATANSWAGLTSTAGQSGRKRY